MAPRMPGGKGYVYDDLLMFVQANATNSMATMKLQSTRGNSHIAGLLLLSSQMLPLSIDLFRLYRREPRTRLSQRDCLASRSGPLLSRQFTVSDDLVSVASSPLLPMADGNDGGQRMYQ